MTCNIDRTGRRRRVVIGGVLVAVAGILAACILAGVLGHRGWWIAVAATAASGLFCVYEGAVGWCAVRAVGLWTPW